MDELVDGGLDGVLGLLSVAFGGERRDEGVHPALDGGRPDPVGERACPHPRPGRFVQDRDRLAQFSPVYSRRDPQHAAPARSAAGCWTGRPYFSHQVVMRNISTAGIGARPTPPAAAARSS